MTDTHEDKPQTALQVAGADGTFDLAAGNDAATRLYQDIPIYAEADEETKALLDARIAKFDYKDVNTITQFGSDSAERLGNSSKSIIEKVKASRSFVASFSNVRSLLKDFDFETVGEIAEEYTEKVQRALARAELSIRKNPLLYLGAVVTGLATGFVGFAAVVAGGLGAKELAKRWKGPTIDDLSHEIDKSLLELGEVISGLEEARDKIPGLVDDLNILEQARIQAYSDFGLDVAAAVEAYRRLKEETIPELQKEAANSPAKMQELRQAKIAAMLLNKKATDMDAYHKTSLIQLKTIDDMQLALAQSQLNIDNHLTISQEQWHALLAEAATSAEVADITQAVAEADSFGDKIFEQSQKVSDMAKAMARASFERGAIDPRIVLQHLEKKTQEIVADLQYMDNFNAKMEDTRAQLDAAGRRMLDAALKVTEPADVKAIEAQLDGGATVIDVEATPVADTLKTEQRRPS